VEILRDRGGACMIITLPAEVEGGLGSGTPSWELLDMARELGSFACD